MDEARLRELIRHYGFTISEFANRLDAGTQSLEYRGVMWSSARNGLQELERSPGRAAGGAAFPDIAEAGGREMRSGRQHA